MERMGSLLLGSITACVMVIALITGAAAQQAASPPDEAAEQTEAASQEEIFSLRRIYSNICRFMRCR